MLLKQLTQLLNLGMSVSAATDQLRVMINDDQLVDRVLVERDEIIASQWRLSVDSTLFDPEDIPGPWYQGPVDTDKFWPKLRETLLDDPGWVQAVPSLDEASTRIVTLLADPHSPVIATRGLVLGYVQSGKTANFTATIAKAADSGYRMFIVLSGVHNSLRRQTQLRMDEQLCDLNPTEWIQLTDEFRDFGNPVKALPLVAGTQLRLLAVVKKNVSRLTRLREWLESAHKHGGLDNCPVLIIDDEADQASPNSHKDPDLDRTRINEELVALLSLPRVAYVGYTATPFANILANPADLKGIYPRTFIRSLPKPDGYFGAEELFGDLVSEDEETPYTRAAPNVIRYVPPGESAAYVIKAKEPYNPVVTKSLEDALRWFILATAARRLRAGKTQHSSMLVHTTMRVAPQIALVTAMKDKLAELRMDWSTGERLVWQSLWERETTLEPAERHGYAPLSFHDIQEGVEIVLRTVNVVADNGVSSERLLYADDPATVIAVGGNTLSRGLTLHGLVSSFFLRSSNSFDSILQMGRWFGYRPGYADLPRIWTTKSLAADFQFLSSIEAELRADIDRYTGGNTTPLQLAVRIQLHPRMQPTSKLKMHYAVKAAATFSEQRPQSTYLDFANTTAAEGNLEAARNLIEHASSPSSVDSADASFLLFRDLPVEAVAGFLAGYKFNDSSEMANGLLESYIDDQNTHGALATWNVAIVTRKSSARQIDLGLSKDVNLISRSKLDLGSDAMTANIGTLMSRKDRLVDLAEWKLTPADTDTAIQAARNASERGLILLYPIDKDSIPKSGAKNRLPLGAVAHQIGVAFVFPKAAEGSEDSNKVQVDLRNVGVDDQADDVPYVDNEGSRDDVELDE